MSDKEDNPLNDEDRKPAAKNTTPTPDGVPSTYAGLKRKSTSTRTSSMVSTNTQEIKREPVVKTETAHATANKSASARESEREPVVKTETATATAPANTSNDQAEAPIPTEPVSNGPNLNRTVTVRRKVAKRTYPLYLAPPQQNIALPLAPSPPAEEIPARKKRRLEEPLPRSTDEAARETASPDISIGLPSPDPPPPSTATVDISTCRRSRHQIQLPPIEMSETQLDDSDEFADDDCDLPSPSWEARLSELADYRKLHGHCSVPYNNSENSKLATWVINQGRQYRLHQDGEKSNMTLSRMHKLESLGFEWDKRGSAWEDRLSELADYRKIHGHCNVPKNYSENIKLGRWVANQRNQYRLHVKGNTSYTTRSRIQELESLGVEWDCYGAAWEHCLSELADYRKIHGHCNVPRNYVKNTKLANWVNTQRHQYKFYLEKKTSHMTLSRIQELESLGFKWRVSVPTWDERLSDLADYLKIHGHCNVPKRFSENAKLGEWVQTQRKENRLHRQGKPSPMTPFRIQALESLGFKWTASAPTGKTV
jgi:hypothetical protein